MRSGLQVRAFDGLDEFRQAAGDWEDLVSASSTATIFSTWEWLHTWWQAFAAHQRARVLGFFDARGGLVAVCPLYLVPVQVMGGLRLTVLKFIGDGTWDSDNLDIPARAGSEEEVAHSLLDYLRAHSDEWDLCELNTLLPHSVVGSRLLKRLREGGSWNCRVYQHAHSRVVLGTRWDQFLDQMKEKTNLIYYTRRLEKAHKLRLYHCETEEEVPAFLDKLFELHGKRWEVLRQESGSFASAERRAFYREMTTAFLRRGWLRLWLLDAGTATAAASFNFRFRDTVYGLQSGFNPDFAKYRAGFVLKGYVIRKALEEGARIYDFLGGVDPNKERWGVRPEYYMDLHFARAYGRGSVYLSARHHAAEKKDEFRDSLPAPLWRLLKGIYRTVRNQPDSS